MGNGASEPRVVCVLVTWNSGEHTERCLRALLLQDDAALSVVVVDNGSSDGSVSRLRAAFPSVAFLENGYNAGYSKACNIGARWGLAQGAEFVWFLNNDTEAAPSTLRRLVAKADSDAGIGIVGAVLHFLHDPRTVQAWGGGSISRWSGFNRHYTAPHAFDGNSYITFASALVRKETFEDLRGLWEGLFLYFEDADFSLRAVKAGWSLAVAEDTGILHAEGGSVGRRRRRPLMEKIQTTSGMRFLERHGAMPVVPIAVFLVLRIGKRIALGEWAALGGVLAGAGDWWRGRTTPYRDDA